MATSRTGPAPTPRASGPTSSVRLSLSPAAGRGPLDGAWWPRTHVLVDELAELSEGLPESLGPIHHATCSRPDWGHPARVVKHPGGRFRVGSFALHDQVHALRLTTGDRKLTLLVIPPETPPRQARAALRWGASPTNVDTADEILMVLAGGSAASSEHWPTPRSG